ncbi:MAG: hypothetical protein PF444_03790, partial [Bacteroidales bacterium]|nr:hypothetical protein [Bacteroidales bacterium]
MILFCFLIFTVNGWADKQYSFLQVSNSDGLVNNQVTCIHKDKRGFVWIGTTAGLSRYDGSSFVNYKHNSTDSNSIVDNYIVDIQEDKQGDLLIKTRLKYVVYDINKEMFYQDISAYVGLDNAPNIEQVYVDDNHLWLKFFDQSYYKYLDPETKELVDIFSPQNENQSYAVDFLYANGDYYYLFSNGTIECYNGEDYSLKFQDDYLAGQLGVDSLNTKIFVDAEGDIWFYGNNEGLYYYKTTMQHWQQYAVNSGELRLTSNLIRSIIQDEKGQIWVGTDHGGIDVINKYSKQVVTIFHQSDNEKSVAQNSITELYIDNNNIIWVGTYKNGVSYYHESIHKFQHYQHLLSDPFSLPYNDVNCFEEDKYGNLWIGTNGGGLIYFNRKTKKYKTYRYDKNNPKSLSSDVVVGLFIDSRENLWVGTFTGGLNRFDGKHFKR